VEISFEDNKVDDSITSKCVYETVKSAVQEAHGDYGRACLARSLKGSSIYRDVPFFAALLSTPLPKNIRFLFNHRQTTLCSCGVFTANKKTPLVTQLIFSLNLIEP